MTPDRSVGLFLVGGFAFALTDLVLFHWGRNAVLKRRHYWWFQALGGVLFLGFMTEVGCPVRLVAGMAPFAALIIYLNVRNTRFCRACGETTYRRLLRPLTCSKCGSHL